MNDFVSFDRRLDKKRFIGKAIIVGERNMIVAIIITILAVAIVATLLACCKISGDCSRDEENRETK